MGRLLPIHVRMPLVEDDNGFYIDPALSRISGRTLYPALNPQIIVGQDKTLTITWEQIPGKVGLADQLLFLAYDPEKLQGLSVIYQGHILKQELLLWKFHRDIRAKLWMFMLDL